jgi:hypothetical protein
MVFNRQPTHNQIPSAMTTTGDTGASVAGHIAPRPATEVAGVYTTTRRAKRRIDDMLVEEASGTDAPKRMRSVSIPANFSGMPCSLSIYNLFSLAIPAGIQGLYAHGYPQRPASPPLKPLRFTNPKTPSTWNSDAAAGSTGESAPDAGTTEAADGEVKSDAESSTNVEVEVNVKPTNTKQVRKAKSTAGMPYDAALICREDDTHRLCPLPDCEMMVERSSDGHACWQPIAPNPRDRESNIIRHLQNKSCGRCNCDVGNFDDPRQRRQHEMESRHPFVPKGRGSFKYRTRGGASKAGSSKKRGWKE